MGKLILAFVYNMFYLKLPRYFSCRLLKNEQKTVLSSDDAVGSFETSVLLQLFFMYLCMCVCEYGFVKPDLEILFFQFKHPLFEDSL